MSEQLQNQVRDTPRDTPGAPSGEVELTIVTMRFDASDPAGLAATLSKYVVTTRHEAGCRNVDLCVSVTRPGRFVIIEKWESPVHQQTHFDGSSMVEMATSCRGLLSMAPEIDLLEGISAHDLN